MTNSPRSVQFVKNQSFTLISSPLLIDIGDIEIYLLFYKYASYVQEANSLKQVNMVSTVVFTRGLKVHPAKESCKFT